VTRCRYVGALYTNRFLNQAVAAQRPAE